MHGQPDCLFDRGEVERVGNEAESYGASFRAEAERRLARRWTRTTPVHIETKRRRGSRKVLGLEPRGGASLMRRGR
jgi:hypothetical protein